MSLIDEALKRAELEAARRDGLRGGTYPWVPEDMPERRRRRVAAVVLVCLAVAAGAAMWVSRRPAPVQGHPTVVRTPMPKIQIGSPKEMETVEVAPPPVGKPSRVLAATQETSDSKKNVDKPKPPAAPPAGEPRPVNVAPEGKATHGLADGRTYLGEVTLPGGPKIELGGIVFSESNPVALINGRVLGPGAVVEEFTIISILPDRVGLKGRGVTIFLALK